MDDMDIDVYADADVDAADAEVFDELEGDEDDADITKSPAESEDEEAQDDPSDEEEVEVTEVLEDKEKDVREAKDSKDVREPEQRVTEARLTRYECVRILGARAMQLAHGAPATVSAPRGASPVEIATLELESGKTPFLVVRPLPCGTTEEWRVSELVKSPGDVHPIVRTTKPYYHM